MLAASLALLFVQNKSKTKLRFLGWIAPAAAGATSRQPPDREFFPEKTFFCFFKKDLAVFSPEMMTLTSCASSLPAAFVCASAHPFCCNTNTIVRQSLALARACVSPQRCSVPAGSLQVVFGQQKSFFPALVLLQTLEHLVVVGCKLSGTEHLVLALYRDAVTHVLVLSEGLLAE